MLTHEDWLDAKLLKVILLMSITTLFILSDRLETNPVEVTLMDVDVRAELIALMTVVCGAEAITEQWFNL